MAVKDLSGLNRLDNASGRERNVAPACENVGVVELGLAVAHKDNPVCVRGNRRKRGGCCGSLGMGGTGGMIGLPTNE